MIDAIAPTSILNKSCLTEFAGVELLPCEQQPYYTLRLSHFGTLSIVPLPDLNTKTCGFRVFVIIYIKNEWHLNWLFWFGLAVVQSSVGSSSVNYLMLVYSMFLSFCCQYTLLNFTVI